MSTLTVAYDGPVARLTLSRAERLNALNDEIRKSMADVFGTLEERPDIRVLVLDGAGRSFSAGADLKTGAYADLKDADWATRRHRTGSWQRLLDQLGRLPQVTVARLHGHVIGGAALLAAACDIRVAADDVVVRIPELAIGIPLTWAGIPLLVREIGLPLARDWVMTCREVYADELLRSGFAQRVVSAGLLDAEVSLVVEQLLSVPPGPLAMTRSMTAALGRGHPAMAAGWGDADHQQWAFTEAEYRQVASQYMQRLDDRQAE
ncbi:MAG TPA: enoyl-CoA hydratase/isomerase family protein [Acidimicrobiales bacterium]|jgi:enoyl-CoA hydratase/carnithine racemase|nr:enoyl-CoA hydratase/isomerase family protein [Acidimicrobiales bacterium]